MRNLGRIGVMIFAFCMLTIAAKADIFDDVAVAIRSGNASAVSKYFATSLELKTVDKSNVYSKNQAELVLKDFFSGHAPRSFTVIHRGSSAKGARYAIGSMETAQGSFRVYLYITEVGGQLFIQELSFEKE
ncbi:MAG: DUF4783 domain-containing protein [Sphingobacteriales bacterium]|nr:MAG: DUF4783 domain-containing protein [Sphingobacteriales bacterium]